MFPVSKFRLIGLTWGESDESEILRPNREEKAENGAGNGRASPTGERGTEDGGRAESLWLHGDNDAGRWWCPAACITAETVSG